MRVYNYGKKTIEAAYWLRLGKELGAECTIKASQPANFLTPIGSFKKRKEIEGKGLPNLTNARFITLTVAPERFGHCPEECYEAGKRQLRQFTYELRKRLGVTEEECPHVWKLEFHDSGFPHWHLIFLFKKLLPYQLVDDCWRLGRTNVKRVLPNDFEYMFKYSVKSTILPHWIAARKQLRFWQTSKHFYTRSTVQTDASPRAESKDSEETKKSSRKETTLGERFERWMRTIAVTIGQTTAIIEIASFPALLRRAANQIVDDLAMGYDTMDITPISVTMPSQRAIEFLENEFTCELETLSAA